MMSLFAPLRINLSVSALALVACLTLACQVPVTLEVAVPSGLPPGGPPLTFAVVPGPNSLGLVWSPVEGAERYLCEASAVAPTTGPTVRKTATATTATVTDLVAGDHVAVRIRAENDAGASAWSEPLDLTFAADSRKWYGVQTFQTSEITGPFEVAPDVWATIIETTDHEIQRTWIAGSGWVSADAVIKETGGSPMQTTTTRMTRFGRWEAGATSATLTSELVDGVLKPLVSPVVVPVSVDADGALPMDGELLSLTAF